MGFMSRGIRGENRKDLLIKIASAHIIPITMALGQVLAIWLSAKVGFFPGSEQFVSIIATCAEIIAGLYGITLAGYTFFLSRIDALMAADATLDYVVASIKSRFKYLIWYITSNVVMTLLICILLMYAPVPTGADMGFFYRLFCNEFLLFMAFSVVLILCYSVQVINPNCVEKEAKKLKRRLEGRSVMPGDTVMFLDCYEKIVKNCQSRIPTRVQERLHRDKGNCFELTLGILEAQSAVPKFLLADIRRIHRYYECVVNCGSLGVSLEMCHMAKKVQKQLERSVPLLLGEMQ